MAKITEIDRVRYRSNDSLAYEARLYSDGTAREFSWSGDPAEDDIEGVHDADSWQTWLDKLYGNPQITILSDDEWEHFC